MYRLWLCGPQSEKYKWSAALVDEKKAHFISNGKKISTGTKSHTGYILTSVPDPH